MQLPSGRRGWNGRNQPLGGQWSQLDSSSVMAADPTNSVRHTHSTTTSTSNHVNSLAVEPALFQKKLSALFRRHPNTQEVRTYLSHSIPYFLTFSSYSQAVDEFSDGLKKYTEDHVRCSLNSDSTHTVCAIPEHHNCYGSIL